MVSRDCGERGIGSYCLMGIKLKIYKVKRVMEMDGGDGCMR